MRRRASVLCRSGERLVQSPGGCGRWCAHLNRWSARPTACWRPRELWRRLVPHWRRRARLSAQWRRLVSRLELRVLRSRLRRTWVPAARGRSGRSCRAPVSCCRTWLSTGLGTRTLANTTRAVGGGARGGRLAAATTAAAHLLADCWRLPWGPVGLLVAAQDELGALASAWRRDRSAQWRSFYTAEMAGGGRRLFRWLCGAVAAPPPPPECGERAPLGTPQCLEALHAGW